MAEHVDVIVCDEPGQRPTAARRAAWLREIHPEVDVHVVPDICGWHTPDPCPPECSPAWALHLGELGHEPWDAVVSAEDYGTPFAVALGAVHHRVVRDPNGPSGAAIRHDLAAHWDDLDPIVRRGLTRKLVIVGAESTGTTTLATALAEELGNTECVLEAGRTMTQSLAEKHGSVEAIPWAPHHFRIIAKSQELMEEYLLNDLVQGPATFGPAGPWLVCDTDLLATSIWYERYVDISWRRVIWTNPEPFDFVGRALRSDRPPTLYVLTSHVGVPFEQDGMRDGEHLRPWMTERFCQVLSSVRVPWIEVIGTPTDRVNAVLAHLETLPPVLLQPGPQST